MVKKENMRFQDLLKVFYKFDIFTKNISYKALVLFDLICLFLLGIMGTVSNNIENYSVYSNSGIFFFGLIGMPIMLLLFYGLFFIFLNAFTIKSKKGFFESYLVFLSICCPFILLGNIFNILGKWSLNSSIIMISLLCVFAVLIYFFVSLVLHFKQYVKDSGFKVSASIILSILFVFIFTILNYLVFLINSLK